MIVRVNEAANYLKASKDHVYRLISNGELKHNKIDGKTIIDKIDLLRKRATVYTFFNQKGGVSKTSASILAGDYFQKRGFKTLLIDLDPQANLTESFIDPDELEGEKSIYDIIETKSVKPNHIVKNIGENLDLLPSNIKLSKKDQTDSTELLDLKYEDFAPFFKRYEIIIIDCPPSLGALSLFGTILANFVIMPVNYTKFCYDGFYDALNTVNRIKRINEDYIDLVSIRSRHSKKKTSIRESYQELYEEQLGDKLTERFLPDWIGIEERADMFDSMFNYEKYKKTKTSSQRIKEIEHLYDELYEKTFTNRVVK